MANLRQSRNRIALLLVALLCIGFLGVAGYDYASQRQDAPATPPERITIAAYAGQAATLVWIAERQGFFDQVGLDVTVKGYEAGKLAMRALAAGEVEVATGSDSATVKQLLRDDRIRVLSTLSTYRIRFLVAGKDSAIKSASDVAGKRIGVTRGTGAEHALGGVLLANGLVWDDIKVVDLKPSKLIDALADGRIDAALTWQPNIFKILERMGDKAIKLPLPSDRGSYFVLAAHADWIAERQSAIDKLLRALVMAEEFVKSSPEVAQNVIASEFGVTHEYMAEVWPDHQFSVALPQALLLAMENQARWLIQNSRVEQLKSPNILDFFATKNLRAIDPKVVTVID